MASESKVRHYLAYWLQFGKKIIMYNGTIAKGLETVIQGDGYSPEFEDLWVEVRAPDSGNCRLEGIWETIDELLTQSWDIILHNFIPQVISVSRKQTVNTSLSSLFPENSVYQRQSLWQSDRRYLRNIIDRVDRMMDRSCLYSE
jgi:hypothetical protein